MGHFQGSHSWNCRPLNCSSLTLKTYLPKNCHEKGGQDKTKCKWRIETTALPVNDQRLLCPYHWSNFWMTSEPKSSNRHFIYNLTWLLKPLCTAKAQCTLWWTMQGQPFSLSVTDEHQLSNAAEDFIMTLTP